MLILGIETSCDETSAAVLKQDPSASSGQAGWIQILSNVVSSSLLMHAKYGGVVPEQAAREQIKSIIPVIEEAMQEAGCKKQDIDAIAVTYGPGLIGSLLVGVETAKVLASIWSKPLIPVNHLLGHFWANWISPVIPAQAGIQKSENTWIPDQVRDDKNSAPKFPCIGLLVSGGHTDLVLFRDSQNYEYLGGTRDDAAGECFDKCARVLGLPYPGGPKIAKLASQGSTLQAFELPSPMINSKNFEFSFSGLKTAFVNIIGQKFTLEKGSYNTETQSWTQKSAEEQLSLEDMQEVKNICASLEKSIVSVLVEKTVRAAKKYKVEHIMIAGGVAANQSLSTLLDARCKMQDARITLHIPPPKFCTDNAAMIAARGFFEKPIVPLNLQANPNLSL